MRPVRNYLWDAGIPVENSKGEAETGQEELNIKYANALHTAEYHTIAKHAVKKLPGVRGMQLLSYQSGITTRWVLRHTFTSHLERR